MAIPTTSWDETSPSGSQSRALGDDRIREMKTQIREVIAVDHEMASSGSSDTTGYHNKVTFIELAESPAMVANTVMLYAKEVSGKTELFMDSYDSSTAEMQLTSNGDFIGGMRNEIRMWSGTIANIPAGWSLCDGTNATPNLLGRFVRGVPTAVTNPGTSGGSDTHTHTANAHTHTVTAHTHTYSGTTTDASSFPHRVTMEGSQYIPTNHTHDYSGTTSGGSADASSGASDTGMSTVSSLPAYYQVALIIKI